MTPLGIYAVRGGGSQCTRHSHQPPHWSVSAVLASDWPRAERGKCDGHGVELRLWLLCPGRLDTSQWFQWLCEHNPQDLYYIICQKIFGWQFHPILSVLKAWPYLSIHAYIYKQTFNIRVLNNNLIDLFVEGCDLTQGLSYSWPDLSWQCCSECPLCSCLCCSAQWVLTRDPAPRMGTRRTVEPRRRTNSSTVHTNTVTISTAGCSGRLC